MHGGVIIHNLTDRESRYIVGGPEDSDIYREDISGFLCPMAAFGARKSVRTVAEALPRSDGAPIKLAEFRERHGDTWVGIRAYLEKLTEDNDICYCEDEGELGLSHGYPRFSPCEGGVEALNRRRDATSPLRDNTQIARPTYNFNAPGRVAPMAVSPPRFANLDASGPSLANVIPYSAHTASAIPNLVPPVLNFYGERKVCGMSYILGAYVGINPGTSPNSAKLSAWLIGLCITNDNAHDAPNIYAPHRGWYAYDVFRNSKERGNWSQR